MSKKLALYSAYLTILIFFASISGVFATWFMAEEPPESIKESQNILLSEFVWKPEEILPSVTPGQNYLDLYESILENVKGGLNSSKDTLEKAVLDATNGMVHCDQNVQGGNLKHLFITEASRELDFIVQYISDSTFKLYTYKQSDTNGAIGTTKIQVYMTILTQVNNVWDGEESQVGFATLQYFPGTNISSIDVSTWSR